MPSDTPRKSEQAATAIRHDIVKITRGRPMHWVAVHEVAQRLGLPDEAVKVAVRSAIDKGWFIADAEPPHSIRLTTCAAKQLPA